MSSKRRWCWRELYWPRPLKWTMVQQLMHRLVADPGLGPLVIETRATNATIRFQIAADVRCIRVVESLLGELVPGMQTVTAGVRLACRGSERASSWCCSCSSVGGLRRCCRGVRPSRRGSRGGVCLTTEPELPVVMNSPGYANAAGSTARW